MPPLTLRHPHPWDLTPSEAVALQRRLEPLVEEVPLGPVGTIGGLDMSVREDRVRAAVVVVRLPDFAVVDEAIWEGPVEFPYVPGLLSFREAPAVLRALEQLRGLPDVLMCDAQGRAHPRRFGLACHLGVVLDHPTIGVAKSLLVGRYQDLGEAKGSAAPLVHRGETVGAAVRTRDHTLPVYVSVGHRATLSTAVALTLATAPRFKIPEPTRLAHKHSRGEL